MIQKLIIIFFRRYFCGAKYTKNTRIDGKVVIITGANTGLGLETAVELAKRGGKIYIACRDKKRGEDALKEIKKRSGSKNVHLLQLDLSSLESVREFSKKFHKLEKRLDILINNAGLSGSKVSQTKDGFEIHMGVNHLGHFLLTNLLLDLLKASAPSRIEIVASGSHYMTSLAKDDFNFREANVKLKYAFAFYARSKLANVLHGRYLAKKLEGTGVTVNSLCPGFVRTDVGRQAPILSRIVAICMIWMYKTVNEGVQTQLMLACDPDLEKVTGKFFMDCKEKEPAREAFNEKLAERLWNRSMELTSK